MTVGAGFMIDAMKRARHFEREMAARRVRVRVRDLGERAPDDEPFPCGWVCQGCGLMRDAPEDQARADAPCSFCKARAWIDLRSFRNAQLVRESEERLRQDAPQWARRKVRGTAGVVGVALAGTTMAALAALMGPLVLAPAAVIAAASGGAGAVAFDQILGRSLARWLIARADMGPARWRCALPKPDLQSPIVARHRGVPQASAPLLRAPISGRECLAYEVGVIFDAEGDAYPPVWVLREDRNTPFSVDGVEVDRDALTTELSMFEVNDQAQQLPPDDLRRFLRERGLFVADGSWDFFESILPADTEIDLCRHGAPEGAPWVVYDPPGSLAQKK